MSQLLGKEKVPLKYLTLITGFQRRKQFPLTNFMPVKGPQKHFLFLVCFGFWLVPPPPRSVILNTIPMVLFLSFSLGFSEFLLSPNMTRNCSTAPASNSSQEPRI